MNSIPLFKFNTPMNLSPLCEFNTPRYFSTGFFLLIYYACIVFPRAPEGALLCKILP